MTAFQRKYIQFFPNKQSLILKVREVRQKMMAIMKSPFTTSTGISSSLSIHYFWFSQLHLLLI